jgi:putative aldouronate transport system permease protein
MIKKKACIGNSKTVFKSPELLLMMLPGFALLVIFRYIPLLSITVAFKQYSIFRGIADSPWIGFKHFQDLFSGGTEFLNVLLNTIIISLYKIIFGFPMPIILALLLNEARNLVFKRVSQNIYYLPHFLSWVVIAGLCYDVLNLNGIVNTVLKALGFEGVSFLMDPKWIRTVLIVTDIWKGAGYGSIIYLAALTSIDPELYDAAKIDGAGKFAQLWYITLPGLVPVIIIMLVLRLSSVLSVDFDQILMLTNAAVRNRIDVIDTYVYRQGITGAKYDYSTAVGLFKSAVSVVFVLSTNYILKKKRGEGLW